MALKRKKDDLTGETPESAVYKRKQGETPSATKLPAYSGGATMQTLPYKQPTAPKAPATGAPNPWSTTHVDNRKALGEIGVDTSPQTAMRLDVAKVGDGGYGDGRYDDQVHRTTPRGLEVDENGNVIRDGRNYMQLQSATGDALQNALDRYQSMVSGMPYDVRGGATSGGTPAGINREWESYPSQTVGVTGFGRGEIRPSTGGSTSPTINGDQLYQRYRDIYNTTEQAKRDQQSFRPAAMSADEMRAQAMDILEQTRNGKFAYDLYTDPLYLQARDAYMSQGQLNANNAAAQAAALTGGYGNSYGTVAAQQQLNQAASDLNAIAPELYNQAYGRWADDQARKLQYMDIYNSLANESDARAWEREQQARQRVLWGQSDEDRARANAWEDEEHGQTRKDWDYSNWFNEFNKGRAGIEANQNDLNFWQNFMENGAQNAFNNWQRNYTMGRQGVLDAQADASWKQNYDANANAISFDEWMRQHTMDRQGTEDDWTDLSRAISVGQSVGDWNGVRQFGLDPSTMERGQQLEEAIMAYQNLGDLSGFAKLGFDITNAQDKQALERAIQLANIHDYSGLDALNIDTSYLKFMDQYDYWKINQAYELASGYGSGSSGGYSGGGGSYSGGGSDQNRETNVSSTPSGNDMNALYNALAAQGFQTQGEVAGVLQARNFATGETKKFKYSPEQGGYYEIDGSGNPIEYYSDSKGVYYIKNGQKKYI